MTLCFRLLRFSIALMRNATEPPAQLQRLIKPLTLSTMKCRVLVTQYDHSAVRFLSHEHLKGNMGCFMIRTRILRRSFRSGRIYTAIGRKLLLAAKARAISLLPSLSERSNDGSKRSISTLLSGAIKAFVHCGIQLCQ